MKSLQKRKNELFRYLDNNEILSQAELFKILGLKRESGWYGNKQIAKGLKGNICKTAMLKHLNGYEELLQFHLDVENSNEETYLIDKDSGEVVGSSTKRTITSQLEKQPLYQLWHTVYAINDAVECSKALQSRFNLPKELAGGLTTIDFSKHSFGNKSAKAMRKVLPYLMEGFVYSDACSFAGYNHSNSLTTEDRLNRVVKDSIEILKKNSLRQPIVEKIMNQLINVVNSIIKQHGSFGKHDEIRIELARELKQSQEERNETFASLNKRERENEIIRKKN